MTAPLVLFAIAAAGGSFLAYLRFNNKPLPMSVALLHGLLAVSGLIALGSVVLGGGAPDLARIALGLFVAAALGGITLFSFHLRAKPLPLGIVAVHGLVAVVAFIVLLVSVVGAG